MGAQIFPAANTPLFGLVAAPTGAHKALLGRFIGGQSHTFHAVSRIGWGTGPHPVKSRRAQKVAQAAASFVSKLAHFGGYSRHPFVPSDSSKSS